MSVFWADLESRCELSWENLIEDLNCISSYNIYCFYKDDYDIFKHIITSLLLGQELVLLDSDFSSFEIEAHLGIDDINNYTVPLKNSFLIKSKDDLIEKLRINNSSWKVTLFTSGTTGQPKKICHKYDSLLRFTKINTKYKNDVWGFAFNPTHIAGVQVFFQALLNGNTIIKLFGLSKEDIYTSISKYQITHISATPTFYRLLLPHNSCYLSLLKLTSGGEKFDKVVTSSLLKVFPNATFTNIYASTEAGSLLSSKGELFTINPNLKDYIRIVNDELVVNKNIMGQATYEGEQWYFTGDIVEIVEQNPLLFRFVTRKNELINVGGYKVNPLEVEDEIRKIEGVLETRVYSIKNSVLGNIVCCDIQSNNTDCSEKFIREKLKSKLQEYKIPRIIKFVEQISKSRTGKLKRN